MSSFMMGGGFGVDFLRWASPACRAPAGTAHQAVWLVAVVAADRHPVDVSMYCQRRRAWREDAATDWTRSNHHRCADAQSQWPRPTRSPWLCDLLSCCWMIRM